jgi:1-acyl-sn-glycerol-3-phosphate acyltransferase
MTVVVKAELAQSYISHPEVSRRSLVMPLLASDAPPSHVAGACGIGQTDPRARTTMIHARDASASHTEHQVLAIVAGLVAELGGAHTRTPALDDSLERDLGISSLERVELLLRLERQFSVRLPDSVMAEAATPQALVDALRVAAPAAAEAKPAVHAPQAPGAAAPSTARTLTEVLAWHAERTPDRAHIHLRLEDGRETAISYQALLTGASAVAGGLRGQGVAAGDTVVLMLRTEEAFFTSFFGTLLAGAVPVPIYPPVRADQLADYARRQRGIVANAGARLLVTFAEAERLGTVIRGQVPGLSTITTAGRLAEAPSPLAPPESDPARPALIQYTSGSTGSPKGVLLTHANLLANVRAVGEAIGVRPDDVTVSWLPLYHDMGLIGAWLASLYFGVPVSIMSPLAFLNRPARWLWAIHAHRGTVSPAPNFAYDLCVRRIEDAEIEGLDLSSWRLAMNGSEMVSPETIERFTRRFAPYGFRPETMYPVYGLAESSVGLAAPPLGRPPRLDHIAREPFERAREVTPAPPGEVKPLHFVSCGRPLPGHEVRIVDRAGVVVREDRREGHVQFRGPSVTAGYFRNPEATAEATDDGWMKAGDLGYWAGGELFITGREKDVIIQGGRNVYAQEVEDSAARVDGIRKGCVAAFGVHDAAVGTERLVVVAETRERDRARRETLREAVLERVVEDLGVPPDVVVIAGPGAVLKTSSGKVRRNATREAYLAGRLGRRPSAARQWIELAGAALTDSVRRGVHVVGRTAFTAWVLVLLAFTVPVLWALMAMLPRGRTAARVAAWWARLALALGGCRLRVTGAQYLKGLRSAVLVANHASYLDPLPIMAALGGRFRFLAKRGLTDYPVIGTVIRKSGYLTVEKADHAQRLAGAEEVVTLAKDEGLLVVFPEGTFVRAPGLLPFRLGAFRAAVEAGRPVVPVAVRGTRHVLPDGARLLRPGRIEVVIMPPIAPRATGWPEMVRLRDLARDAVARECGEAGATLHPAS